MAPVGIPWLEMSRYCEDNYISGGARLRFIRLLRALDTEWLITQGMESEERRRKNGKSGSRT